MVYFSDAQEKLIIFWILTYLQLVVGGAFLFSPKSVSRF